MNAKIGILAGMLLLAILAVPVSAEDIQIVSQAGGVTPSFSMAITPGSQTMTLAIGTVDKTGNPITVTTNTPFTLTVKDKMDAGKTTDGGKMAVLLANVVQYKLNNPIQIATNGGAYLPVSATEQVFYSGAAGEFTDNLKFRQLVVSTDPVIPSQYSYAITLTVTGAATAV